MLEYMVNPAKLGAVFMLPCEVVDKHIKLAGGVQLKVLLFAMRNIASGITAEKIAQALSLPVVDVADALLYWTESGILCVAGAPEQTAAPAGEAAQAEVHPPAPAEPKQAVLVTKPSREEIIKRGSESEEIAFLLREAQVIFGRGLRTNESSTLVWLHDYEGMNIAVILMIIEFAKSEDKCSIGYIERTALNWIDDGVDTLGAAEEKICKIHAVRNAWGMVCSAMGIDRRKPSKKEEQAAVKWVDEWQFKKDMLSAAYDECVNHTGKFSMGYIDKVLGEWHKKGFRTPAEIQPDNAKKSRKTSGADFAGYDLDAFQQMLDNEDKE